MMHEVLESLLQEAERQPFPSGHASSYWTQHGEGIVLRRTAGGLQIHAASVETVGPVGVPSRVLNRLERWSYRPVTAQLRSFPAIWILAAELARRLSGGPSLTFQVFKSACAMSVLADHYTARGMAPAACLVIGDGCGFFGALLRRYWTGSRLYCIDLPRSLVLQASTHLQADPSAMLASLTGPASAPGDVNFIMPQHMEAVQEPIGCAVNIASMQEMTPESIAGYFMLLRQRSLPTSRFYCVNRLHKQLPGGEVAAFDRYPWHKDDEVFLDGPCPYYRHYLSPSTSAQGPRLAGVRIPFVNYFDGAHMHRLVRLAPVAA